MNCFILQYLPQTQSWQLICLQVISCTNLLQFLYQLNGQHFPQRILGNAVWQRCWEFWQKSLTPPQRTTVPRVPWGKELTTANQFKPVIELHPKSLENNNCCVSMLSEQNYFGKKLYIKGIKESHCVGPACKKKQQQHAGITGKLNYHLGSQWSFCLSFPLVTCRGKHLPT